MNEEDLNAYVDGALDPTQAYEIACALVREPWRAALAEAYRAQGLGLGALYEHVGDQPVPDAMLAAFRRHAARANRRCFIQAAAAAGLAVAMLLMGARALHRPGMDLVPAAPAPAEHAGRLVPL